MFILITLPLISDIAGNLLPQSFPLSICCCAYCGSGAVLYGEEPSAQKGFDETLNGDATHSRAIIAENGTGDTEPPQATLIADTLKNEENTFVTSGYCLFTIPIEVVSEILCNHACYDQWMLKGLDGRDPVSKNFIGILDDIAYQKENDMLVLHFTINLPAPFGSTGNSIDIRIDHAKEQPLHLTFTMASRSLVLKHASLDFYLTENADQGPRMDFIGKVKFTWIIDLFFSQKLYQQNIEWRLMRIVENLIDQAIATDVLN